MNGRRPLRRRRKGRNRRRCGLRQRRRIHVPYGNARPFIGKPLRGLLPAPLRNEFVSRLSAVVSEEYPSAADDAERIRLFIRDCYTRWGTKWVLLGGDAALGADE